MSQHEVVVVGGGLAGLVAALHLAEAGLHPLVLEAAPQCGGRVAGAATVQFEHANQAWAFTAEHGIHGVWGQYHNLRAVLQRLGLLQSLVPARREDWLHAEAGSVRRAEAGSVVRRSWFPAPFHYLGLLLRPSFLAMLTPHDLIALPRVVGTLFTALAYDPLVEPARLSGRTLAGWFNGWPPRLRAFIAALLRSGLADHPEQISLGGFLAFLRFYTLLRRDAWQFAYFPSDSGTALIAPLCAAIEAHGGRIQTNCKLLALNRASPADDWDLQVLSPSGSQQIHARQLVLALDAPAARSILTKSPATAESAQALRWPQGLTTGIVRFWFAKAPHQGAESGICSGDFIIDNFFWLHQFQHDAAAFHQATGGSVVEAHIYGPPEVLALPDPLLIARARADILRAYPELKHDVIYETLQRNPPSHTRFETGADEAYLGVASPWPRLACCGDWLRYPHPALFLERATVTGIAAANAVLRELARPEAELKPASRPEAPARALEWFFRAIRDQIRRR